MRRVPLLMTNDIYFASMSPTYRRSSLLRKADIAHRPYRASMADIVVAF